MTQFPPPIRTGVLGLQKCYATVGKTYLSSRYDQQALKDQFKKLQQQKLQGYLAGTYYPNTLEKQGLPK